MRYGDDDYAEARRLNAEECYEHEQSLAPDVACECGVSDWVLADTDVWGADADGRRGAMLRVWECARCGAEREVIYA